MLVFFWELRYCSLFTCIVYYCSLQIKSLRDWKVGGDSWWVSKNFGLNWKFQLDLTDIIASRRIKILIFNLPSVKASVIVYGFMKFYKLNQNFQLDFTDDYKQIHRQKN